ncbi:MAG TPA: neutral zinc metallopeptidase [Ilumatobacter sp.]|jgi:predicted metalloprotease|nr:neutral zinc metallopeptidase [Ilumatobacter sp.]
MTKIRSRNAGRIEDRRGAGGGGLGGLGDVLGGGLGRRGGGGGFPIPGGLAKGGGGLIGLLVIAAVIFLPKLLGGGLGGSGSSLSPAADQGAQGTQGDAESCSTELEQVLCGAVNDVSEYWITAMPTAFNREYVEAPTVFFSDATNTGCGQASAQTGPFYCPADGRVYFDLDFLTQLQETFGATGDLAAQYIVAHEYGHHVQNVVGINEQMRQAQQADPSRANQYSVALELQADCFAGVWADTVRDRGLFESPQEVEEALNAAAAVGDDRIQQKTQGRVDPESFTHGTSAQRVEWFQRGFTTGDPNQCSTFNEVL